MTSLRFDRLPSRPESVGSKITIATFSHHLRRNEEKMFHA